MASSHERLLEVVHQAADDEVIRGVFVSGSRASGTEDAHSDLDLVVVTLDDQAELVADALGVELRAGLAPVSFDSRRLGPAWLLSLITAECVRADLLVSDLTSFKQMPRYGPIVPVLDRDNLAPSLLPPSQAPTPVHDDAWFLRLVQGVLRTMALLPMVIGRAELLRGQQHVQLLKQDLLDLLLFANGDPPMRRPGIWQWSDLNDRLPPADRDVVERLPAVEASRDSVVDGHLATYKAFLVLARRLAADRQLEWPQDFENAVNAYLKREGLTA